MKFIVQSGYFYTRVSKQLLSCNYVHSILYRGIYFNFILLSVFSVMHLPLFEFLNILHVRLERLERVHPCWKPLVIIPCANSFLALAIVAPDDR